MWSLKKVWVGSLHVLIQMPRHLLSSKYLHFSTNTPLDNDFPLGSVTEFTELVPISHWHESAVALATIMDASWPLAIGAKRALKRTSNRGGNSAWSTRTADCSVSEALFPLIMSRFATSISPSYPGFWESHPTSYSFVHREWEKLTDVTSTTSAKKGEVQSPFIISSSIQIYQKKLKQNCRELRFRLASELKKLTKSVSHHNFFSQPNRESL